MAVMQRLATAMRVLTKGVTLTGVGWGTGRSSKPAGYTVDSGMSHVGTNAVVAACVGEWTRLYAQAPIAVVGPDGNVVEDHPALRVITGGNVWMNEREIKTLIQFYKLLTGTAYGIVYMGEGRATKTPIGIGIYSAANVQPVPDDKGRLSHFRLTIRGTFEDISVDRVIRFPWDVRDPANPICGMSPLQACFNDAESYKEVSMFVREFLQNGAFPGTMVVAKDGYPDEEMRQKNKQEFKETFGAGSRGSVGFFSGDIDVKAFAHGLKDLDLSALRDTPEASICAAFGVPPELIGVKVGLENSTYSNKEESRYHFATGRVAPAWETDAMAISQVLLPLMGYDDHAVVFETSNLPFMQESADRRYARATSAFEKNLISRDEARAEMGYDAVDKAPVYAVTLQQTITPVQKSARIDAPSTKSAEDDALFKSLDDEHQEHIDRLSEVLAKAVDKLKTQVMAEATKSAVGTKRDLSSISEANLRKLFIEASEEVRIEIIKEMIKRAVELADFDYDSITSWLDDAVTEAVGVSAEKIKTSTETMRDEIKTILQSAGRATAGELTEMLSKYFETLGSSRVVTISVTTATAARSTAQNESWDAINKRREDRKTIKKKWLSMRDGAVRDAHANADGQTVEVRDDFEVGGEKMPGPGLGGKPENNINCRCVEIPVTSKKGK